MIEEEAHRKKHTRVLKQIVQNKLKTVKLNLGAGKGNRAGGTWSIRRRKRKNEKKRSRGWNSRKKRSLRYEFEVKVEIRELVIGGKLRYVIPGQWCMVQRRPRTTQGMNKGMTDVHQCLRNVHNGGVRIFQRRESGATSRVFEALSSSTGSCKRLVPSSERCAANR